MFKNPNLVLIGDVHGKTTEYLKIASQFEYSIQIGDFDFKYDALKNLDPSKHVLVSGNHDNYDILLRGEVPHYLGDFGIYKIPGLPLDGKIFFVRGAWSIDQKYRKQGVSWWAEEELTIERGYEALDLYEKEKPQIVITHEAPKYLIDCGIVGLKGISIQTRTATLLQQMLEIHRPQAWIFGHHHVPVDVKIQGTQFICLPELGTAIIPLNGVEEHRIPPKEGIDVIQGKEYKYQYVEVDDVLEFHGKDWAAKFFRERGPHTQEWSDPNHIGYGDYIRFANRVDYSLPLATGEMD